MNIIGGIYKGRVITMPGGPAIRPTSNKVREALFNILGERVRGAVVLELFAGSGSLGIEAISRGAKSAVFVDNDAGCSRTIRKNLKSLGISGGVKVTQLNVVQAIKKLDGKEKFDMIFMDPPYSRGWIKKILINLGQYDILNHPGLLICEHHKKDETPQAEGGFVKFRENRYGDTVLSFYKKHEKKSGISGDI